MAVYTTVDDTALNGFLTAYDIGEVLSFAGIAEGVENMEQVKILRSYGCQYFQGYYFSKPIRKNEFISLCNKNSDKRTY